MTLEFNACGAWVDYSVVTVTTSGYQHVNKNILRKTMGPAKYLIWFEIA